MKIGLRLDLDHVKGDRGIDLCVVSPCTHEGNGLMRVAAKAFHFEIAEPGFDRVASVGDGCAGP